MCITVVHTTNVKQCEAVVEIYGEASYNCLAIVIVTVRTKYCTYTLMNSAMDLILQYSLMQCTETGSSVAMEKGGLRWCLDKLMVEEVNISTVATDRHTGVASLI